MKKFFIFLVVFLPIVSFSLMKFDSNYESNDYLIIYGNLNFDSITKDVPLGVLLLEDIDTKEKYSTKTDSIGAFLFKLPTKVGRRKFNLIVMVEGFNPIRHVVLLPVGLFEVNLNDLVSLDMEKSIGIICTVSLDAIHYKSNEFYVDSVGKIELNKLVVVLNQNPTLIIEVGSHTDYIGSVDANLKLSNLRAKAVINYVISKGISKDRIFGKGYGETRPIEDCNCKEDNCSEKQLALNRRTEFRIAGSINTSKNSF